MGGEEGGGRGRGRGRGRDYIHRSLTFMKLPSSTMGFARVSFLLSKHVEGGGAGGWRGEMGGGVDDADRAASKALTSYLNQKQIVKVAAKLTPH